MVAAALSPLFPPWAAVAAVPVGAVQEPSAYPEERAAVAGAVAARRRQFYAGRACAHLALARVDRDGRAIGCGSHRQPVWPAGAVGSISHAGGLAAAVAARSHDARGLGLDIETRDPPLDPAVERLVLTPAERVPPAVEPPVAAPLGPYRSKIAFTAKECVYKALFPLTGWPLDFPDVVVEVDLRRGRYRAVVHGRFRLGGLPLPPLDGTFRVVSGYLLTALTLEASFPPSEHQGDRRSGPRKR